MITYDHNIIIPIISHILYINEHRLSTVRGGIRLFIRNCLCSFLFALCGTSLIFRAQMHIAYLLPSLTMCNLDWQRASIYNMYTSVLITIHSQQIWGIAGRKEPMVSPTIWEPVERLISKSPHEKMEQMAENLVPKEAAAAAATAAITCCLFFRTLSIVVLRRAM